MRDVKGAITWRLVGARKVLEMWQERFQDQGGVPGANMD